MIRYYFSKLLGTGSQTAPFRPVLANLVDVPWTATDGRADMAQAAVGWMLVAADVTPAQHATIIADARVLYLPIEDAAGEVVPLEGTLVTVSAPNRQTLRALCEQHHVPIDDLNGGSTVRQLLRRMQLRALLRQLLGPEDYTEGFDTLVSDLTAARRQRIRDRLEGLGFDVAGAGIVGTDTIREALRKTIGVAPRVARAQPRRPRTRRR